MGKPDQVDCTDGKKPVIIDVKTSGSLPSKRYLNVKGEAPLYSMGLKELGFHLLKATVEYVLKNEPEVRATT